MTPKQILKVLKNVQPGTYMTCKMSAAFSKEKGHMVDYIILKVVKANKNGILTVGYVHRFRDSMRPDYEETFVFDTQRSVSKPDGQPYDQITVIDLQKRITEIQFNVPEDSETYDRLSAEYLERKIEAARKQLFFYKKALNRSHK